MQGDDKTFRSKLKGAWQFIKKIAARVWAYLKVAKMEYIVMISLFALDLITKAVVNACVGYDETVVLIPKFLNIHNYHNYDAAFGSAFITNALGPVGSRILFCVFAVAASVVFIIILIKQKGKHKLFRLALAMLTAGAMGNCIDRWALGFVRDFIEFEYFGLTINGSKTFYIFNIADAELVIAVVLVVIYFIFVYKDKSDEAKTLKASDTAELSESGAVNGDAPGGELPENAEDGVDTDAEQALPSGGEEHEALTKEELAELYSADGSPTELSEESESPDTGEAENSTENTETETDNGRVAGGAK